MHAVRWSALTALGAAGGSWWPNVSDDRDEFCDCIIIIYPYIINTDHVVMCDGHGQL